MNPSFADSIENWLVRFSDVLERWEETLTSVEHAYSTADIERIVDLCNSGELIHQEISNCKQERDALLSIANSAGQSVDSIKELASFDPDYWNDLTRNQFLKLEFQLQRIQRLSIALSVSAYQSHASVNELLQLIATGRTENATYSAMESDADYGGHIINEAA